MPISNHPSFARPPVTTPLWRYADLPKFVELLTSASLWLTNLEVLASHDPYEGSPGPIQFAHRLWSNIEEVPEPLRKQILTKGPGKTADTPEQAFRDWFMLEEQRCHMERSGRRDFYVSCWHAADYESLAMWKIYSSPGAGIAIVTNGGRLESALSANKEALNLGAVKYRDPRTFQIGWTNTFDPVMVKSASYSNENEVRLVHWDTTDIHDTLANSNWNDETMRFDDLIENPRALKPGMALTYDIDVLIERVVVSPLAPPWYAAMIERLRDRLEYKFPVKVSKLLTAPEQLP